MSTTQFHPTLNLHTPTPCIFTQVLDKETLKYSKITICVYVKPDVITPDNTLSVLAGARILK